MASIPTVGGDSGTWGTGLKNFLEVSHDVDGTLKTSEVAATFTPSACAGAESVTLPNGFIIKIGSNTSTVDTAETFTFSAAFPTACLIVLINRTESSDRAMTVESFTSSNFVINRPSTIDGNQAFTWIAFGY